MSALEFFDAIWLRRPCLDRFAVFAKASRNLPLRSKRFAVSALAFLTLRQSYAVLLIETEGQSDLTF